jgi:hypothetical protein
LSPHIGFNYYIGTTGLSRARLYILHTFSTRYIGICGVSLTMYASHKFKLMISIRLSSLWHFLTLLLPSMVMFWSLLTHLKIFSHSKPNGDFLHVLPRLIMVVKLTGRTNVSGWRFSWLGRKVGPVFVKILYIWHSAEAIRLDTIWWNSREFTLQILLVV